MSGSRIGIDARFYGTGSGLARYTRELIDHLARLRSPHTFVVLLRKEDVAAFPHRGKQFEVLATGTPHYSVREQVTLGQQLTRANLDLMHFTNFNYPVRYRRPFIVTIHDLTLFQYAGRSRLSRLKLGPMRAVLRSGIKHSRKVVTISEYQRKLIQRFGAPAGKVQVIHEAVDSQFKPQTARSLMTFRRRAGLSRPYLLYTGEWREHKNLVRLFKAFSNMRQRHDLELVLVGKRDPAFAIIPQTVEKLGLHDDVRFTGFVSDVDLPKYYAAAEAFAFPSLAEGFGLPPLEAMACGTPVASSSAPPMPEILGTAAAFFNPRNTAELENVLERVLTDKALRHRLRSQGLRQAKQYSWQRTARETLALYESLLP